MENYRNGFIWISIEIASILIIDLCGIRSGTNENNTKRYKTNIERSILTLTKFLKWNRGVMVKRTPEFEIWFVGNRRWIGRKINTKLNSNQLARSKCVNLTWRSSDKGVLRGAVVTPWPIFLGIWLSIGDLSSRLENTLLCYCYTPKSKTNHTSKF